MIEWYHLVIIGVVEGLTILGAMYLTVMYMERREHKEEW